MRRATDGPPRRRKAPRRLVLAAGMTGLLLSSFALLFSLLPESAGVSPRAKTPPRTSLDPAEDPRRLLEAEAALASLRGGRPEAPSSSEKREETQSGVVIEGRTRFQRRL